MLRQRARRKEKTVPEAFEINPLSVTLYIQTALRLSQVLQ